MCRKLIYFTSFALVLSLVNNAKAELVAHWPFDDSGTIAYDAVGSNDGTLVGDPQWVAGTHGGALEFDGSGDYVDIAYSSDLSLHEFTLSAWVKIATEPGVFGIHGTRAGADFTFDVKVQDSYIHGDIGNGSAWIDTVLDIESTHTGTTGQGGDLAVGTWYMITYVFDNTNQQVRLFLDGDLKRTISISGTPLLMQSGQTMRIGHTGYADVEWMNGLIDDVQIYNHALTEGEILAVMEGEPWPYALSPNPADDSLLTEFMMGILGTTLTWKPGDFAATHDVYFGDDFDDVNDGTGGTFRGNQTDMYFLVGYGYMPNDPLPGGFVPGT
ncbi:MAG: LamG domain-containing protein, partial [Planctomycetota bacterium]